MGFALVFFIFAALFAWAGGVFGNAGWAGSTLVAGAFYWAALAELIAGSMYLFATVFRANPGWILKNHQGKVRFWPRLLIWPYLFFEYMAWRRYRERGREPLFEQVRKGLFIGARIMPSDLSSLRQAGISAVLDLAAEFADPAELCRSRETIYLALPALDGTAPSEHDLEQAIRFINASRQAGGSVLVHCTFGHGRSAIVVAAALIAAGEAASGAEALEVLRGLRRRIWLSREQKRLLERFAKGTRPKSEGG